MEVKEKLITEPNQLYPYRAFLETLINYEAGVLKNRHIMEGWDKDTGGHVSITKPDGENLGLKQRMQRFDVGKSVSLIGRLHLDLWHQDKTIPGNVPIKIRLIPNNNKFLLKTEAPTGSGATQEQYKLVVSYARLYIHTKKICPNLVLAHRELLQSQNFRIPFTKVNIKKYTIPSNSSTANFNSLFQGPLPDRVLICFVRDDAITGSYNLNPYHLDNLNINFIAMTVNGELFPKVPLQPNFTSEDYIREYMKLLTELGYDIGEKMLELAPSEWANGFTFFVFKITPGPIGAAVPRAGVANLEIKFASATSTTMSMLCLSQQQATMEIDKFDNVILS